MQFGQVPIQFVPDAPVINTNALTLPAEDVTGDQIVPSRNNVEPPPTVFVPEAAPWGRWVAMGALLLVVLWAMSPPRR